jgi:predicted RNA binding protein YcfA (HicA-like mRNA interferase family)
MSRIPSLKPKQVVAALRKAGFQSRRHKGSHHRLAHPDGRIATVPIHAKELKRSTMLAIVKQAGMTQDEFRKLL